MNATHIYQNSNQYFQLKPVYILEVDLLSDEEYPAVISETGIFAN
jgi:hypothetical protein